MKIRLIFCAVIAVFLLMVSSCASSNKTYHKKKHPTETKKSYASKKGLMILDNTQMERNKYMRSKNYKNTLQKAYKKNK